MYNSWVLICVYAKCEWNRSNYTNECIYIIMLIQVLPPKVHRCPRLPVHHVTHPFQNIGIDSTNRVQDLCSPRTYTIAEHEKFVVISYDYLETISTEFFLRIYKKKINIKCFVIQKRY